MHKYTPNLEDFDSMKETESCYLDGRYFNKVFAGYPGLITEPLNIIIRESKNKDYEDGVYMKSTNINNRYPGLMRVIINTPTSRHSNLLVIDYENQKIYRFEPLVTDGPFFYKINELIEKYMDLYLDFTLINIPISTLKKLKNEKCLKSGYCMAYVIKYGMDWLNSKPFDHSINIRKFASAIEHHYGSLPETGKDIEYGFLDNPQGRNTLIGGLGGAAIGGLLTGSGSVVLLGCLLGAGAGYVLSTTK